MAPKSSRSKLGISIPYFNLRGKRSGDDAPILPPSSMAPELKLFVFIIGFNTPFSVKIQSSETVDDLKERILEKNPNGFKGVDAASLTLYRVELPDDDTLEQSVAQAVNARRPLRPSHPLSEIFPANPPTKTINIVVKYESPGEWGN